MVNQILQEIVARGRPCLTAADLAASPGELEALQEAGLVEPWDRPNGLAWTLTPLAAGRLGVRIASPTWRLPARWVPQGTPVGNPRSRHQQAETLDDLTDRGPARPVHLVGLGLPGWPGPGEATCPCCHGQPLSRDAYCLRCDRWGRDGEVAAATRAERSRSTWTAARRRAAEDQCRKARKERRRGHRRAG